MEQAKDTSKIVGKIKKLLALATSNVEAESMAAMMKAQELMGQYGISSSDVEDLGDDSPKNQEGVVESKVERARFRWWMKGLASLVAENTACFLYMSEGRDKSHLIFLGRESNTILAREIYTYAYKVMKYGMSSRGYDKAVQKNEYANGFLVALRQKFKENVETKALAIIPDAGVEEAKNALQLITKKASGATVKTGDHGAFVNGMSDGKNFDKDRKQVEA